MLHRKTPGLILAIALTLAGGAVPSQATKWKNCRTGETLHECCAHLHQRHQELSDPKDSQVQMIYLGMILETCPELDACYKVIHDANTLKWEGPAGMIAGGGGAYTPVSRAAK